MDTKKKKEIIKWAKGLPSFFASCGIPDSMNMAKELVELLKEQDAVKPFTDNEGLYWCASCEEDLVWHQKYCSNCGRAVKWE